MRIRPLPLLVLCFLACGALPAQVRISQIYGGGGNAQSVIRNDFVELYNPGVSAVSLDGASIQYAAAAGTTWAMTPLSGNIPAGGSYLVQESAGTDTVQPKRNLPTPDATGSIAMSATSGKIALVASLTALAGACPAGWVDLVGYGSSANCFRRPDTNHL
jgi:predicted extracellular nuclease